LLTTLDLTDPTARDGHARWCRHQSEPGGGLAGRRTRAPGRTSAKLTQGQANHQASTPDLGDTALSLVDGTTELIADMLGRVHRRLRTTTRQTRSPLTTLTRTTTYDHLTDRHNAKNDHLTSKNSDPLST
jgi:hypothetical protein